MDVPTSEVGYAPVMPRREDHEVHKRTFGGIGKKKNSGKVRCLPCGNESTLRLGGGRILLGDNIGGGAVLLQPIRFLLKFGFHLDAHV